MVAHFDACTSNATHSTAPDSARHPHRVLSSGGGSSSSAAVKKPALSTNPPRVRSSIAIGARPMARRLSQRTRRVHGSETSSHESEALMSEHQQRFKVVVGGSG